MFVLNILYMYRISQNKSDYGYDYDDDDDYDYDDHFNSKNVIYLVDIVV